MLARPVSPRRRKTDRAMWAVPQDAGEDLHDVISFLSAKDLRKSTRRRDDFARFIAEGRASGDREERFGCSRQMLTISVSAASCPASICFASSTSTLMLSFGLPTNKGPQVLGEMAYLHQDELTQSEFAEQFSAQIVLA